MLANISDAGVALSLRDAGYVCSKSFLQLVAAELYFISAMTMT